MADEVQGTLADALRKAMVDAHHETVDHAHETAAKHRTAFMEAGEQEIADMWREKGLPDFRDPDFTDAVRAAYGSITDPTHQFDFLYSIIAALALAVFGGGAIAAGYASQLQNKSMTLHGQVHPDIGTLARLAAMQVLNPAEGVTLAGTQGFKDSDWTLMQTAAESWPSLELAFTLWRRGWIDDRLMDTVLHRNGYDNGWTSLIKHLKLGPPDTALAVAAATQNQLGEFTLKDLLEQNGIDPKYEKMIYETSGQTMPPDMAMRLFREGWIDEPKFLEILTESQLKNKYVPLMANLRFRYPPMEQTLRMHRRGIIDAPTAQNYLEKQGFFPDDARKLVESAGHMSTTSTKNLSPSVIERLYELGRFSRDEAAGHLQSLGYDATEADLLLFLSDEMKAHSAIERAATSIGTRYVSWKIDRAEVVTLLDRINYPAAQRDELLEVWDARREAQTLHLSEAFLHKAFKVGAIDGPAVRTRLLAMGYDEVDTDIIMRTDFAPTTAKPKTKDLTRADETKRYKAGIIDKATFHGRLTNAGYDATEADQIIQLVDADIAKAAEKEAATNGA